MGAIKRWQPIERSLPLLTPGFPIMLVVVSLRAANALFTTEVRGIGVGVTMSRALTRANAGGSCVESGAGRGVTISPVGSATVAEVVA